jgi:hypothetical protein
MIGGTKKTIQFMHSFLFKKEKQSNKCKTSIFLNISMHVAKKYVIVNLTLMEFVSIKISSKRPKLRFVFHENAKKSKYDRRLFFFLPPI